ncbi:MAG: preprotein translocase subunit SecE [Bacteroidaceae bacterium]|jgi:preprotein translocase subunit SecE|nr:preprotein translocase subunit SecE [Bacteroidaceae bacterium]
MHSIINYCKNSFEELVHKTTWPSRSELTGSAVIVLIASLVIALVVFAWDFVVQNCMEFVYEMLH